MIKNHTRKLISSFLACYCIIVSVSGQIPKPSSGTVQRFGTFISNYVLPRNIDVWLPKNYNPSHKYAVLYMHDGQMLYDSIHSWNHQEWKVDETLTKLIDDKKIRECLVVGIWNSGEYRHADYFPQKPLEQLPANIRDSIMIELKGKPMADDYLRFITLELKPFIDNTFPTLPGKENTFIAGSSMGGLISMYAICEYPEIFGGAACLSTHWIGSLKFKNDQIGETFNTYLATHLPDPATHKIYFDFGTETLDSHYKPYQQMIDRTMKNGGYTDKNWITREFPGEDHSEKAWSKRFEIPVNFLLEDKR